MSVMRAGHEGNGPRSDDVKFVLMGLTLEDITNENLHDGEFVLLGPNRVPEAPCAGARWWWWGMITSVLAVLAKHAHQKCAPRASAALSLEGLC